MGLLRGNCGVIRVLGVGCKRMLYYTGFKIIMLFSDKYNKMAEFLSKIYFTVKKYPREPSETFRNNR